MMTCSRVTCRTLLTISGKWTRGRDVLLNVRYAGDPETWPIIVGVVVGVCVLLLVVTAVAWKVHRAQSGGKALSMELSEINGKSEPAGAAAEDTKGEPSLHEV